jgi:hypothetical protein
LWPGLLTRVLLGGVLLASPLLAGCSGSPAEPEPAGVAGSTTAAPTGTPAPTPPSVDEFARRLASATEQAGTVAFAGEVQTATGSRQVTGRYTPEGGGSLHVETELPEAGAVEIILSKGGWYVRNRDLPEPAPGRPWVRVAMTEAEQDGFAVMAAVSSAVRFDALAGLAPAATLSGPTPEPFDGTPADRYDAVLDVRAAAESDDPELAALAAAAAAAGTTSIETTYWVDASGRPVQLWQQAQPGPTARSRLTFSGWGTTDAVQPPPEDDVVDGADLP